MFEFRNVVLFNVLKYHGKFFSHSRDQAIVNEPKEQENQKSNPISGKNLKKCTFCETCKRLCSQNFSAAQSLKLNSAYKHVNHLFATS